MIYQSCTTQTEVVQTGYVGSETCKSCHANAYAEWEQSHHFHAMELPSEKSVRGDFSGVSFSADGDSSYFYKTPSGFAVNYTNVSGNTDSLEIAYTFGWTPLQQYLVKTTKGRYQTLRASWNVEENRWFNQYSGDTIKPGSYLHQFGQSMTWNTMCADCHSTNLEKNYFPQSDSFFTTYSEATVGCEGCHGPAAEHVQSAQLGKADLESLRLVTNQTNKLQVEQCAPCHMRRVVAGEGHMQQPFNQAYLPQTINNMFYHPDGQIEEEDYVWGSFVQSKMYHEGVKCTDCHNPHTNALKFEGNKLCLQCHDQSFNQVEHHFHAPNSKSAECINCHMTGKNYMGNDFRRDHSFRIPRPDLSITSGAPNACTGCHTSQSDAWAAKVLEDKFGAPRRNYADVLTAHTQANDSAYTHLKTLLKTDSVPLIAQITALEYVLQYPSDEALALVAFYANNPNPQMRNQALSALVDAPKNLRLKYGVPALSDSNVFVRHTSALLTADAQNLNEENLAYWKRAQQEYQKHLNYQADFREGRMALAQYAMRQKRFADAIKHYKKSIMFDQENVLAYTGWATALAQSNQLSQSYQLLKKVAQRFENNSRVYFLTGITAYEQGDLKNTLFYLKQAVELSNYNAQYTRNYALILAEQNQLKEAGLVIKQAINLNGKSADLEEVQHYIEQR